MSIRKKEIVKYIEKNRKNESNYLGVDFEDENEIIEQMYKPSDTSSIRIETKYYTISQICWWIESDRIELQPDYQRDFVWSKKQQSLLIESLMLRIPINPIYMNEEKDGRKMVIDGLQRLSTINNFINNKFKLIRLYYLSNDCNNCTFYDLPEKYKSRILDTQLIVYTIDSRSPYTTKFDLFQRVNTGGIPLNAQEIRNAMATQSTRKLLRSMVDMEAFKLATHSLIKDVRMDAQELCLRFIVFFTLGDTGEYFFKRGNIAKMMDDCVIYLNELSDGKKEQILQCFEKGMLKSYALFGEYSFLKSKGRKIINRAQFTTWSIVLANSDLSILKLKSKNYRAIDILFKYLKDNKLLTISNINPEIVSKQFSTAYTILEEIMND